MPQETEYIPTGLYRFAWVRALEGFVLNVYCDAHNFLVDVWPWFAARERRGYAALVRRNRGT